MKYGTKKRSKFVNSNKGISMVELICSLGIASLLAATFFRFFVITAEVETKAFNREQSQIAITKAIEDYQKSNHNMSNYYYNRKWKPVTNPDPSGYSVIIFNQTLNNPVSGINTLMPPSTLEIVEDANNASPKLIIEDISGGVSIDYVGRGYYTINSTEETVGIKYIYNDNVKPEITVINNSLKRIKLYTQLDLNRDVSTYGPGVTTINNVTDSNSSRFEKTIVINVEDGGGNILYTTNYTRYGE